MWKPTVSSDEIWHHGILGQKYGKRNGPPYPLDASDHSAKEKAAGWKESLHAKDTKARHKELAKKYKEERKEARERTKRIKKNHKLRGKAYKDAKRVARSIERDKEYKAIKEARDADHEAWKEWIKKNGDKYSQSKKYRMTADFNKQAKTSDKNEELRALTEKYLRKKLGKKYDKKIVTPYGKETTRGQMALESYIRQEQDRRN